MSGLRYFVKTDDLGYGDLRVYPNPNSHRRLDTPNLDRLARQSMLFIDAYAGAPVCAPSRCALVGIPYFQICLFCHCSGVTQIDHCSQIHGSLTAQAAFSFIWVQEKRSSPGPCKRKKVVWAEKLDL